MTISLSLPQQESDLKPRITVIGVGGAGGNAVNNMISSALEGVEFVVANTDAQALGQSLADRRIQLGISITQGLGAGARPAVGKQAAEEALPEIMQALEGSNMVFVTAGMGGGTGTGAAPVIAQAARDQGILTVGVVTKPFHFEGRRRMTMADDGISELEKYVDTLIIIPNQNLFKIANEKTTFADAFKMADDVLYSGVRGVTDLMVMPGLINLDFADIRTVMGEMGKAMMGTGEAEGPDRAKAAAEAAISNPLLEDASMKGAKGVLINITGGLDMTLLEVDEAANRIREEVDPDADIIFGSTFDAAMQGRMRVSVVATGISAAVMTQPQPTIISMDNRSMQTGQPHLQRVITPQRPPSAYATIPQAPPTVAPAPVPPAPPVMTPPSPPVAEAAAPEMVEMAAPQPVVELEPVTEMKVAEPVPEMAAPTPAPVELPLTAPVVEPTIAAAPRIEPVARPAPVAKPIPMAVRTPDPNRAPTVATKGPSLFQKMTGLIGGGSRPAVGPEPAGEPQRIIEPAPPQRPAATITAIQPPLSGLDANRAKAARDEDDLQIPAFLRRQAN
ncbi:MAG: cell division protein FtsZ [Alphaproteobacteria bacterium]|nr:cell division protein FtsZ [Alphaproteobacteria bacterium]MCW5742311.1 cell division protein FtsZ [Alphaproteobacteria bacterium]